MQHPVDRSLREDPTSRLEPRMTRTLGVLDAFTRGGLLLEIDQALVFVAQTCYLGVSSLPLWASLRGRVPPPFSVPPRRESLSPLLQWHAQSSQERLQGDRLVDRMVTLWGEQQNGRTVSGRNRWCRPERAPRSPRSRRSPAGDRRATCPFAPARRDWGRDGWVGIAGLWPSRGKTESLKRPIDIGPDDLRHRCPSGPQDPRRQRGLTVCADPLDDSDRERGEDGARQPGLDALDPTRPERGDAVPPLDATARRRDLRLLEQRCELHQRSLSEWPRSDTPTGSERQPAIGVLPVLGPRPSRVLLPGARPGPRHGTGGSQSHRIVPGHGQPL
jgi:hypothetical protein